MPPAEVGLDERQRSERERRDVEHPAAHAREEACRASALLRNSERRERIGARSVSARQLRRGAVLGEPAPVERERRAECQRQARGGGHRRSLLERQVRLRCEGGNADAREIEPPLVDHEAPFPAREELAIEREQVVELELALQRRSSARRCTDCMPVSSSSGASSAANGAKFSDTRSNPAARAHAIDAQISHSLKPFGVVRNRGIDDSESDDDAGEIAKCRKPRRMPGGIEPDHEERVLVAESRTAHRAPSRIHARALRLARCAQRAPARPAARRPARSGEARGRRTRRPPSGARTGEPCECCDRRARTSPSRRRLHRRGRARAVHAPCTAAARAPTLPGSRSASRARVRTRRTLRSRRAGARAGRSGRPTRSPRRRRRGRRGRLTRRRLK